MNTKSKIRKKDLDDVLLFTEIVRGGVEVPVRKWKLMGMVEKAALARWR